MKNFEISTNEDWLFSPVMRRNLSPLGEHSTVTVSTATGDVPVPVIFCSDLHHNADEALGRLVDWLDEPREWTLFSVGDMAGSAVLGSDGDAIPVLEKFAVEFGRLFFVQGNHDIESVYADSLRNADGTPCHVHGKRVEVDGIGTVGGVDGIVGTKRKPHRIHPDEYERLLLRVTAGGVDFLLTHEPPLLPEVLNSGKGSDLVRKGIDGRGVRRHIFGHCHYKTWFGTHAGTEFFGVDGRMLCIRPA